MMDGMNQSNKGILIVVLGTAAMIGVIVGLGVSRGINHSEPVSTPIIPTQCGCFLVHNVRVVDGDTFDGDIFLPLNVVLHKQRVRVLEVDAYEMRGDNKDKGLAAKQFVEALMEHSQVCIEPGDPDRDVFGRVLATVTLVDSVTGEVTNLASALIQNNHAAPEPARLSPGVE